MAQAIDLPEALPDTAPQANADDLLSQLAGEEIDRLLAEAEVEKPPAGAEHAPEASAPQPLSEVAAAAPQPAVTEPAATAIPATGNTPHKEAITAELDELFKELNDNAATDDPNAAVAEFDAIPEADAAPEATAAVVSAPHPAIAPAPVAKLPEQPTTKQEQAALKEDTAADSHDDVDESASLPIYLKPLEWLNMPLQLVPEPARDLVGKVAIVTFMNAVAVLAYLVVFRRH